MIANMNLQSFNGARDGVVAAARGVIRRSAMAWWAIALLMLGLAACAPAHPTAGGATADGASEVSRTSNAPSDRSTPPERKTRPRSEWRDVGFRTMALFKEHYAKHGREFGDISPSEYLAQAQALRDGPSGGNVLEMVRDDGVTARLDRGSGTFIAFNRNGTIRTCFKPRDGERYFRRQAMRNEGGR